MSKTNCFLEIDYFSGRPNPKLSISQEDFTACYDEIYRLERAEARALFDGLGFRGFILSGPAAILFIQKTIIRIADNGIEYRKNNQAILAGLFALIRKYDRENDYKPIVEAIKAEYLDQGMK